MPKRSLSTFAWLASLIPSTLHEHDTAMHDDALFLFRASPSALPSAITTRPNPLEPVAAVHSQHPLQELNFSTGQEWQHRLLQDPSRAHDSASKRRKPDDAIALPRLPVRDVHHRPRLPPTLSGLHQPPPNAGLLPSISTVTPAPSEPTARKEKQKRRPGNKWTEAETSDLMNGVARFGIGSWTAILKCEDFHFNSRTALDLKDRFRVCRPSDYKGTQAEEKNGVDLARLGSGPFARSSRRRRHGYTEQEDSQLLIGFERHGKQWSRIQKDPELALGHRTRTDLRDRLRTKFPDLFNAEPDKAVPMQRQPSAKLSLFDTDWSFDIAPLSDPITLDRNILSWPTSKAAVPQQWLYHNNLPLDDIDRPTHSFLTFDELLS